MAALSPRLRQPLLIAAAVGAFVALGATWLWRFRRGQPVDIDEAGYISIAISDLRGWEQGGIGGWWDAVQAPSIQAPLMTAMTTPVFVVAGPGVLPALLVPLLLGGVMLLAAHGLGHEVGGRRVAWLTLAMTAAAAVVVIYSRSYNFAIASGAMAALMLWSLARSRGFEHLAWSSVTGAAIGLLALSRTYSLALLPALALVALVALATGPRRGRRLVGASLAALVALVVAGPWYRENGELVWDYLTSYGYGSARTEYGADESVLSSDSWRNTFRYAIFSTGLPLWALWAVGLGLVVAVGVLRWRRLGAGAASLAALRSPVLPSLVWAMWGLLMLTSTGNKGSGFLAPLVPALAVVAARGIAWLPGRAQLVATIAVVATLALNTVASLDPRSVPVRSLGLPWLGDVTVVSGQGVLQLYLGGEDQTGPTLLSKTKARAWQAANHRMADLIGQQQPSVSTFGFRHRLVNPNSVQLVQLVAGDPYLPMTMISPTAVPNDLAEMATWLSIGDAASTCLLFTARGTSWEFEPRVDPVLMTQAARATGFLRTATVDLPDGRTVVVWRRPATCPVPGDTGTSA